MSKRPLHTQLSAAMLRRPPSRRTTRTAALPLTVAITWHIGIGPPSANLQLLQGTNASTRIHTTTKKKDNQNQLDACTCIATACYLDSEAEEVKHHAQAICAQHRSERTHTSGGARHTDVVSTQEQPNIQRSTSITFNAKRLETSK